MNGLFYIWVLYWRNLFPSGMNFVKYSAQNDVCSFDYSTSTKLIKTDTDKLNFYIVCLIVSLLRSHCYCALRLIDICYRVPVKKKVTGKRFVMWYERASKRRFKLTELLVYLVFLLVCICRLLLHLPSGSSCDFPIRHDDTPQWSVHHQHSGHYPAKFCLGLSSRHTSRSSEYSKLLRNNPACGI